MVEIPVPTEGADPAWHVYVIRSRHIDEIAGALSAAGIGNKIYYRPPLHRQPAMAPYADGLELPVTEQLALAHLAIPISPALTAADAAEVTSCIQSVTGP